MNRLRFYGILLFCCQLVGWLLSCLLLKMVGVPISKWVRKSVCICAFFLFLVISFLFVTFLINCEMCAAARATSVKRLQYRLYMFRRIYIIQMYKNWKTFTILCVYITSTIFYIHNRHIHIHEFIMWIDFFRWLVGSLLLLSLMYRVK